MVKKSKLENKVEVVVDFLIPYCVIVLLFMIISELFFSNWIEPYHQIIVYLDWFIVLIFVADLLLKYKRAHNLKIFLKSSWLDILAVFPFFLVFRLWEEIALLLKITSTELRQGQSVLHEVVELQKGAGRWTKEATRLAQEAEEIGKISRSRYIIRVIRPIARLPRLLKIIPFFERPIKKSH